MSTLPDRYTIGMHERPDLSASPSKALQRADLGEDGNRLFMIRGLQRTTDDLRKSDHPHHRLYLDGACQGPYLDAKRSIYSLDHHEGCYRPITDATCIQALKFARKGVIQAVGNDVIGNDPDLDTVLAGWATLNADILAHDDRVFRRALPLFSLEGNIDAYGLGYEELTGLTADEISHNRNRIQWLMAGERERKARGRWQKIDYIDYLDETMRKVDQYMLYQDSMDVPVLCELRQSYPLRNGQTIEFVQAKGTGIYEVEQSLFRHEHASNAACIVFTDGGGKITVKLSGIVNPLHLEQVLPRLNDLEADLRRQQGLDHEELNKARWGGSDSIIGPPRYSNGMKSLVPMDQIIQTLIRSFDEQLTEETAECQKVH